MPSARTSRRSSIRSARVVPITPPRSATGVARSSAYRDDRGRHSRRLEWIENHPFVRDTAALKAQLASLKAQGGGDEPESLLDALYKVATMEATPKGSQSEDHDKWRYRSDAARVVVVFTDASFKETMSIPEAKGGSLQDVANVVMANRIILSLFAPNFEGYDRPPDRQERGEVVDYEGLNAQEALQKFTGDPANFRTTLKQLAAACRGRRKPSPSERPSVGQRMAQKLKVGIRSAAIASRRSSGRG